MGFPSPATDYAERVLSLDEQCNTRQPSVYLFKADENARRQGICQGAVLVVDRSRAPVHGSVVVAMIDGTFRMACFRDYPERCLVTLTEPVKRVAVRQDEETLEDTLLWGVVTHAVNNLQPLP